MQNAIEVKDLTKNFKKFSAVDHISFNVKKGEIFAFLGPNGAGKTTTIKMLTTLLTPTSGSIKLEGIETFKDPHKARELFGIVFQDHSLDDELTAYENLDFHGVLYKIPTNTRKQRIRELLEFVGLWERKGSFVKTFSGGMKRRLEIARGLMHYPKIFFLDEPTLGLDPQTRNHVWQYIKQLVEERNISILFTSHYMDEAERNADRIAIIDSGKIIAVGTPDEIKQKGGKDNLEDAFIELTGHAIRDENASSIDHMRERFRNRR